MKQRNQTIASDLMVGDLRVHVIDHVDELDSLLAAWDHLAVKSRLPYMAPGWCLSWWEHKAPRSSELRVIQVMRGETTVGVAPMFVARRGPGVAHYGLLGAGTSPQVEPLADHTERAAAARAFAVALSSAQPKPDVIAIDGSPNADEWCTLLRTHWPHVRPPRSVRTSVTVAPRVSGLMPDTEWLQTKSRNFRQQARRRRRHLTRAGMRFHLAASPSEIRERLPEFFRLHEERFAYRGGSDVVDSGVFAMLHDAAGRLDVPDRYWLWTIEDDHQVISAHLFVAVTGEVSYWLGGFDEKWGAEQPSLQVLVAAIEHAAEHAHETVDLGPGVQPYKLRLSDDEQHLQRVLLFPSGHRRPLVYMFALTPAALAEARRRLIDLVPRDAKDRLKQLLRRRISD